MTPDHSNTANQWHRQPAIWVVLGVLGFTFVSSFVLLFLAAQNPPEMVVEDYTAITEISAQERARDLQAKALGLSAVIEFDASEVNTRVRLSSSTGYRVPDALVLRIKHSTRASFDAAINLQRNGTDYTGSVTLPASPFALFIEDPERTWRLSARLPGPVSRLELEALPTDGPTL